MNENNSLNYTLDKCTMVILYIFIIFINFSTAASDKYRTLPSIYKLEDYHSCLEKDDLYCNAYIKLKNKSNGNNTSWNLIQESLIDEYSIDRDVIYRSVCIPKKGSNNLSKKSIKKFAETYVNEELKDTDLLPNVEDVVCTEKTVEVSSFDIILLLSILTYIFLVLYATLIDWQSRKHKNKTEYTSYRYLNSLSIISNWKELCSTDGNDDFNRLKSIQGIRFYTMLLVIACHTKLSYFIMPVSNTEEFGLMLIKYPIVEYWYVCDAFLVQIYFMVSSWIVTFQLYNFHKKHGEFTLRHIFILFINRYFRIGVCSAIMVLIFLSSWVIKLAGPLDFDDAIMYQQKCVRGCWKTFLFINNFSVLKDICHPTSWYLSADFQLYIITVVTIYTILKFKLQEWKVISSMLFISYMIYGMIIYSHKLDLYYKVSIKMATKTSFLNLFAGSITYTPTYSCWSTTTIGIGLGIVYLKNKERKFVNNKLISTLWLIISFGLPCVIVFISSYQFKGISAAIIVPLFKPMFSLGIGIAILGMSHNIGGIIKNICENKYIVLLGNFTFSMYIFQALAIFNKGFGANAMLEVSITRMIKSFLFIDAPLCIIVGIIGAVLFEKPGVNLQKIFLPQLQSTKQRKN